ncbi:MAG TPA: transposase [Gemmataceae bacterium]
MCRELYEQRAWLWTFLEQEVEPTNNAAERALRHGVMWRKISHGPKSVVGSEYLGCIWSGVETCRQQGRGVGLPDGLHGRSLRRTHHAVAVDPAK